MKGHYFITLILYFRVYQIKYKNVRNFFFLDSSKSVYKVNL